MENPTPITEYDAAQRQRLGAFDAKLAPERREPDPLLRGVMLIGLLFLVIVGAIWVFTGDAKSEEKTYDLAFFGDAVSWAFDAGMIPSSAWAQGKCFPSRVIGTAVDPKTGVAHPICVGPAQPTQSEAETLCIRVGGTLMAVAGAKVTCWMPDPKPEGE